LYTVFANLEYILQQCAQMKYKSVEDSEFLLYDINSHIIS